jgi:ABC-2 type transport system ATP-binding protein
MKQRLGIAGALLGDPEILLLDEPTNGLDPAGIREMRRLIAGLARERRTILVSSHLLAEVEQVCDWLVMIDQGSLVYQGPTSDLTTGAVTGLVLVPRDPGDLVALRSFLAAGGHTAKADGDHVTVAVHEADPRDLGADINRAAMDRGIELAELRHVRAGLEDQYLAMVGGNHE